MISVLGSINYDLFVRLPRLPQPGESVIGNKLDTACGGKGANQAYAIARMGAPVRMIGCVGDDAPANLMLNNLRAVGVDTIHVSQHRGINSGTAFILIDDASGQNEIVVVAGANMALTVDDVRACADAIRTSAMLVAQLETPIEVTREAFGIARAAGVTTLLNPAPFAPMDDALLRLCDYVVPNETEASALVGFNVTSTHDAERAADAIKQRGVKHALITLGANGVWVDADGWRGLVPAPKVKAVDTVAAGDTFIGAFVARKAEGASVQDAARFGCAAAAISVTRAGAQPSIPARTEVDALLQ